MKTWQIRLGGPGSGNYGHGGRPGKVGGSISKGSSGTLQDPSPGLLEDMMSSLAPEVDMFDLGDTVRSAWLAPSGSIYKVSGEHEDLEKDILDSLGLDPEKTNISRHGFCRITSSSGRQGLNIYVDLDRESTGTKALGVIKDMARMTAPDTMTYSVYSKGTIVREGFNDNEGLIGTIETMFGLSEERRLEMKVWDTRMKRYEIRKLGGPYTWSTRKMTIPLEE